MIIKRHDAITLGSAPLMELNPSDGTNAFKYSRLLYIYFAFIEDVEFDVKAFQYDNGKYYLKNCFLALSRLSSEGEFTYYSNENLEDIANTAFSKIDLDISIPKNCDITTDLDNVTQIEYDTTKKINKKHDN